MQLNHLVNDWAGFKPNTYFWSKGPRFSPNSVNYYLWQMEISSFIRNLKGLGIDNLQHCFITKAAFSFVLILANILDVYFHFGRLQILQVNMDLVFFWNYYRVLKTRESQYLFYISEQVVLKAILNIY